MNSGFLKDITSWPDFVSRLADLNSKEKGDAFESLALHYLRLHPTYLTQLETVWLLRDVPSGVATKLNLPPGDEGIDLIARTNEGCYWAIQCKYREDVEHSLTRRELATFTDLAFGACKGIELTLVCTTADRFSHKLTLHGERLSFLAGDVWRGLDDSLLRRGIKFKANPPLPPFIKWGKGKKRKSINTASLHQVEKWRATANPSQPHFAKGGALETPI